jgi:hypothetical protein
MAFDPMNPPNPELADCWLVYRLNDGRGLLYDSEAVAREAMAKHRHDGVVAFLFQSVRALGEGGPEISFHIDGLKIVPFVREGDREVVAANDYWINRICEALNMPGCNERVVQQLQEPESR